MAAFLLTPHARLDLFQIWDFIADQSGVDRADGVARELESAMHRLAKLPGMGHRRDDLADESLRAWPVFSFVIVYRPETSPLHVVRVLHGARDIGGIFGEGAESA
jgi:antitoxin ParD1/3/4/toxin ParE1/3/4